MLDCGPALIRTSDLLICGGSTGDEFPPLASCSVTDDGPAKHVVKQLYAVLKLGQGTFNVLTKSYSEMDNVAVNNR